ncbi:hypothetical protein K1719_039682 [Acacia pycnantha]|nr:hypothetical protein K1719_039682 [Acacia pycnantha]
MSSSSTTSVHISALNAIVNVNSLFTLAVFIGLTWDPYDPTNSLISDSDCVASPSIAENLVSFHVYSFSSFLFSSLVALALKQAIRLSRSPIKLGTLACGSSHTYSAVVPLFILVPSALLIYVSVVLIVRVIDHFSRLKSATFVCDIESWGTRQNPVDHVMGSASDHRSDGYF